MKILSKISAILFILLSFISCGGDSNDNSNPGQGGNTTTFKATLLGSSEVPSNSSSAMGNATLTLNNDTKMFTLTGSYNGMTPTISHIHGPAMIGVNAVPVFDLTVSPTSGYNYGSISYSGSAVLTTTQLADLMGNLYYVNIHSSAYAGGEIRGQLIKQ